MTRLYFLSLRYEAIEAFTSDISFKRSRSSVLGIDKETGHFCNRVSQRCAVQFGGRKSYQRMPSDEQAMAGDHEA